MALLTRPGSPTGITHPALVNASHIVGWAEHDGHRVNPRNGIARNRLHVSLAAAQ